MHWAGTLVICDIFPKVLFELDTSIKRFFSLFQADENQIEEFVSSQIPTNPPVPSEIPNAPESPDNLSLAERAKGRRKKRTRQSDIAVRFLNLFRNL